MNTDYLTNNTKFGKNSKFVKWYFSISLIDKTDLHMELRQLKYFLKAKELLNFTEAASHLHISQSTLSQQIKQLEEELGIDLFNRFGKRITLSEAGMLFAGYAEQCLKSANDGRMLLKDLSNLNIGEIAIGITYGLRHVLTKTVIQFAASYPKIKLNIFFGTSEELEERLNNFSLDCILTFKEIKEEDNFNYRLLFSSPMSVVAARSTLKEKDSISLKELSKLSLILPSIGYSPRDFIDQAFSGQDLKPNVAVEINDIPTLLDLIRNTQWSTILTQVTIANEQDFVAIPILGDQMLRKAMAISLKGVYEKKAVKAFLELFIALIPENE